MLTGNASAFLVRSFFFIKTDEFLYEIPVF